MAWHETNRDMRGPRRSAWWQGRYGLVLCGFLVVAAFLLLTEHRAHLFGVLPYLFLAACPLMHLFMHHGHGHSDRDGGATNARGGEQR